MPVEEAIQNSSLSQSHIQIQDLLSEIDKIALLAGAKLNPKYRTIGFDIGIDQKGNIWIIEVNFYPVLSMFNLLKDKTMYRTIKKYKKG